MIFRSQDCGAIAILVSVLGHIVVQGQIESSNLPYVTHTGYLNVNKDDGSRIFYSYYESQQTLTVSTAPILLWLQGGPGCAGHFGNFYELGPQWVTPELKLTPNPGAWNRAAGLLFIDQPVGTGFSPSGTGRIPDNEDEIAADLYVALQDFFKVHPHLSSRPFFISGESYAGKYIPAIGHYILRVEAINGLRPMPSAQRATEISAQQNQMVLEKPRFKLAGLAIGNGLTAPAIQVQHSAATLFYSGLIDEQQKIAAEAIQRRVAHSIDKGGRLRQDRLYLQKIAHFNGVALENDWKSLAAEDWASAAKAREGLLDYLQGITGIGTMLDYRRTEDYDSHHFVDKYLNQQQVKEHLGVQADINFTSCSDVVDRILQPDVMKDVANLVPDLLAALPVLLYQGAFDAQDGPAGQEEWISQIPWHGAKHFNESHRHIWRAIPTGEVPKFHVSSEQGNLPRGRVLGYWRGFDLLTHVVIKNAGHMVPRDEPLASQAMIESWMEVSLSRKRDIQKRT